jgi:sulfotransferase family protein
MSSAPRRKVFGVGLNKTGTTTLGQCLTVLGYRHRSYSSAALEAYLQGRTGEVVDMTRDFDSCEDWPWPLVWRELWDRYGDGARYVLTTRSSSEVWVESLKAHSLNTHPTSAMRPAVYGHYYPHGYEAEHRRAYERHNAAVRGFFAQAAPHALLEVCWETGDRWERLCGFLGHPVPDTPFPHIRPRATGVDPKIRAQNQANIERQLAEIAAGRRQVATTPLMRES